jgi:hypothetical protein
LPTTWSNELVDVGFWHKAEVERPASLWCTSRLSASRLW